jgi:hypothetical protein
LNSEIDPAPAGRALLKSACCCSCCNFCHTGSSNGDYHKGVAAGLPRCDGRAFRHNHAHSRQRQRRKPGRRSRVGTNPFAAVSLPPAAHARERRLSPDELLLRKAMRATGHDLLENTVCFALESGMRRGEILGLEWSHLDLQTRTAFVARTKNGFSRRVPLSDGAAAILERLERSSCLCSRCRRMRYASLGREPVCTICTFTICAMRRSRASSSAVYPFPRWLSFRAIETLDCCSNILTFGRPASRKSLPGEGGYQRRMVCTRRPHSTSKPYGSACLLRMRT